MCLVALGAPEPPLTKSHQPNREVWAAPAHASPTPGCSRSPNWTALNTFTHLPRAPPFTPSWQGPHWVAGRCANAVLRGPMKVRPRVRLDPGSRPTRLSAALCSHHWLCQKCSFTGTAISINTKLTRFSLKAHQLILRQSQVCDHWSGTHTKPASFLGTFSEMTFSFRAAWSLSLLTLINFLDFVSSDLDQLPAPSRKKLCPGCRLMQIPPSGDTDWVQPP